MCFELLAREKLWKEFGSFLFVGLAMAYHPKTLQCLSVLQIVTAVISIFLGIGSAVVKSDFTSYAGFGIWVGLWVCNVAVRRMNTVLYFVRVIRSKYPKDTPALYFVVFILSGKLMYK